MLQFKPTSRCLMSRGVNVLCCHRRTSDRRWPPNTWIRRMPGPKLRGRSCEHHSVDLPMSLAMTQVARQTSVLPNKTSCRDTSRCERSHWRDNETAKKEKEDLSKKKEDTSKKKDQLVRGMHGEPAIRVCARSKTSTDQSMDRRTRSEVRLPLNAALLRLSGHSHLFCGLLNKGVVRRIVRSQNSG